MVSLLFGTEDLPTAVELRQYEVVQMHVTLDPEDAFSPLTTVTLRFAGPHALDNVKRFVAERDATLHTFILTNDSG